MTLSDFGSWASIISLVIGFIAGWGSKHIYNIKIKKNNEMKNSSFSLFNIGHTTQKNKKQ